jgi:hypothetical protein
MAVLAFAPSLPPQTSSVKGLPQASLTFERAVDDLAVDKDKATVKKALDTLYEAGTAAFPTLIAHLGDQRKVSLRHFGAKAIQCVSSAAPCPPYEPTIGEACFSILGVQVEGNWPKAYTRYYTLTPENAGAWWEARRGMSLKDLQLEAARSSLAAAKKDYAMRKVDKDTVKFLEGHLKDVREGRCCPE